MAPTIQHAGQQRRHRHKGQTLDSVGECEGGMIWENSTVILRGKHYLGSGWATVCAVRIREEETPQCERLVGWEKTKSCSFTTASLAVANLNSPISDLVFQSSFLFPRLVSSAFCLSLWGGRSAKSQVSRSFFSPKIYFNSTEGIDTLPHVFLVCHHTIIWASDYCRKVLVTQLYPTPWPHGL